MEFTQLIVDYQWKIRDSTESLHAAEELSRKLTVEVRPSNKKIENFSSAFWSFTPVSIFSLTL